MQESESVSTVGRKFIFQGTQMLVFWCLGNGRQYSRNEYKRKEASEGSEKNAKGQIGTTNALSENFPFKKLRRILVNSQYLKCVKNGAEN